MNDRLGGEIKVGSLIDDHGGISWAGADRSFSRFHGGSDHRWATGDAEKSDVGMFAHLVEGLEGWLDDRGEEIGNSDGGEDGFVISANGNGSAFGGGGVRIVDHGITSGDHVDRVTG